jgi:2-phospho-L-lactate guanylyltransferase (CobY/MobA/RfbA family)
MVSYVLRALQQASTIGEVLLAAPSDFPPQPDADRHIPVDGGLEENVRVAIAHCPGAEFVVLVTADIPFLQPHSMDDYVRDSLATGADLCYSAITQEACQSQFPGMKRTYLHTPQGSVTGGNVVVQRVSTYERQAETLREAYAARKNPVFLARLIGLGNVVKLLARRLTLRDIEQATGRIMGVKVRLVVSSHADLGTDVDRPEDLRLARERLRPV